MRCCHYKKKNQVRKKRHHLPSLSLPVQTIYRKWAQANALRKTPGKVQIQWHTNHNHYDLNPYRLRAYSHMLKSETPAPQTTRPCIGRVITCACFLNRARKTFPETNRHLFALWWRDPRWPHKPQAQVIPTPDGDLDPQTNKLITFWLHLLTRRRA